MNFLFAATETAESSGNLFDALGLNLQLLVGQGLAFLILVLVLGKFVYPLLVKAIEDRRAQIEAGMKEAKESQEALAKAESKVSDLLADARKEADDIIARTQQESNSMIAEAEEKAKTRAEQIVADAHTQLEADVRKARKQLKEETVELVALATEKVVNEKLDKQKDSKLISKALEERE